MGGDWDYLHSMSNFVDTNRGQISGCGWWCSTDITAIETKSLSDKHYTLGSFQRTIHTQTWFFKYGTTKLQLQMG
jgi:hypothetical protein